MTDADNIIRPEADNNPKDPDHTPAVDAADPGEGEPGEGEPGEGEQGDHDAAEVDQTGGKVANPYMQ